MICLEKIDVVEEAEAALDAETDPMVRGIRSKINVRQQGKSLILEGEVNAADEKYYVGATVISRYSIGKLLTEGALHFANNITVTTIEKPVTPITPGILSAARIALHESGDPTVQSVKGKVSFRLDGKVLFIEGNGMTGHQSQCVEDEIRGARNVQYFLLSEGFSLTNNVATNG